jgi:hypothetical protein
MTGGCFQLAWFR